MTTPEKDNPSGTFTPFLPTTYNFPEEDDRLRTFLIDQFSQFADVINDKKIGNYTQNAPSLNGEKWAYDTTSKVRNGYQVIARISSFPNTSTIVLTKTSDPQYPINEVGTQFIVTNVWGSASLPCSAIGAGDGVYFSFYSRGDPRITFDMTDTTITITTTVDLSDYQGFIIVEFLNDGT